jgi:2-polyprenyl-3-methyl-5-hydroxy-6-metoxy-1,4-benzoquinol methylase
MTWTLPESVETALWHAAQATLEPGALELRALEAAIAERVRRYTSERERLHDPVAPAKRDRDLAARALFFGVADAAKVAVPIAELVGRGLLPVAPELGVLDVGAGALAMSLGLGATLAERSLAITAVDLDERALALGAAAAAPWAPRVKVTWRRLDLSAVPPPPGPFHLVLAGTVLNELAPAARLELVRALVAGLTPDGALILIEPALRHTARALHALRDAVIASSLAHVFAPCIRHAAPCIRHAAPCPALADDADWCHEDRPFAPPPRLAQLIARTGLRSHGLKFAYLTLRRAPAPLAIAPPGKVALRVVSGAVDQKGSVDRFACGDDGRVRVRVLTRRRDATLAALAASKRGDVLLAEGPLGRPESLERLTPAVVPFAPPWPRG